MAFYENTIVAKQDIAEKELKSIKDKYNELINNSSGKVIKIENHGASDLLFIQRYIEEIIIPNHKTLDLLPRTSSVRKLQRDLVKHYQLNSTNVGNTLNRRVRIYPN